MEETMRPWQFLCLAAAFGLAVECEVVKSAGKKAETNKIGELIKSLGHDRFARREAASKELEAVGAPALASLRKAASADDPEVQRRAQALLEKIGRRIPFDGTDLSMWTTRDGKPAGWNIEKGYMEVVPGQGDIRTKCVYGDCRLHVEFWVPWEEEKPAHQGGNSGIYLQGRYEIQILDSCGDPKPTVHDCGALYGQIVPSRNACKPAEQWQTFDITFRAPRLNGEGNVTADGRLTVVHNGVTVIRNGRFRQACPQGLDDRPGGPGPILLQDHGARVRFRNIRVIEK
jgi:hypothetical protein